MTGRMGSTVAVCASFLALAGCKLPGTAHSESDLPPLIRPVLTTAIKPDGDQRVGFAGTIQPQYQTDRGFQVLGRVISRDVDVGDVVNPGQLLAKLDPLIYQLAVRSSEAELESAKSQLVKTTAAEGRSNTLLTQKVISESDYDTAKQALDAATASLKQAEANLAKSREQLSYTTLTADAAGVVTNVYAEVGQTVSAGAKVMTLARTDAREAVVDVPEDVARTTEIGSKFQIVLQADRSLAVTGKVREIAPKADEMTRTRRIKITLDQTPYAFRLGATITAMPEHVETAPGFNIPVTALLERDGRQLVWLVDMTAKTVRTTPVELAGRTDGFARIKSGLAEGARIVVAGVYSLSEGQQIKIDGGRVN